MRSLAALYDRLLGGDCCACDRRVGDARPLCVTCRESLYPVEAACPGCALPVDGPRHVWCGGCRGAANPVDAAMAAFRYGGELATAIRRMKYPGRPDIARRLATLMVPVLADAIELWRPEVIAPVPLHRRRRAKRGFDQAAVLARHAAALSGARHAFALRGLRRVVHTAEQAGATRAKRQRQLQGAFAGEGSALDGRSVLLIDDVCTTGATFRAAATAARAAGARRVYSVCLARADSPA